MTEFGAAQREAAEPPLVTPAFKVCAQRTSGDLLAKQSIPVAVVLGVRHADDLLGRYEVEFANRVTTTRLVVDSPRSDGVLKKWLDPAKGKTKD